MNFKLTAFRIPQEYIDNLKEIKTKTHISISEQVRSALREYFKKNGIKDWYK